jgi:hypothetical protein
MESNLELIAVRSLDNTRRFPSAKVMKQRLFLAAVPGHGLLCAITTSVAAFPTRSVAAKNKVFSDEPAAVMIGSDDIHV